MNREQYLARVNAELISRTDLLLADLPGRYAVSEWQDVRVPVTEAVQRIISLAIKRLDVIVNRGENEHAAKKLLTGKMQAKTLRKEIERMQGELAAVTELNALTD